MTMITPSYLGETIEYSSLHACRSTLEDPTRVRDTAPRLRVSVQRSQSAHRDIEGNFSGAVYFRYKDRSCVVCGPKWERDRARLTRAP